MTDYQDILLNSRLQKVNSLAGRNKQFIQAINFDINYETPTRNLKGRIGYESNILTTRGSVVMYNGANDQEFILDRSNERTIIKSLDLGAGSATHSGALRIYDSGTGLLVTMNVDNVILDRPTRVGNNYGLTLGGTATQGAPTAQQCIIYIDDTGVGGKGQLLARFPTGATQVIASEP